MSSTYILLLTRLYGVVASQPDDSRKDLLPLLLRCKDVLDERQNYNGGFGVSSLAENSTHERAYRQGVHTIASRVSAEPPVNNFSADLLIQD